VSKHSLVVSGAALAALCSTAVLFAQAVRVDISGPVAPQIVRDPGAAQGPRVQPVPVGTGQISGVVTSSATGTPIRRAVVRLSGPSRVSQQEAMDLLGRGGAGAAGSGPGRGGGNQAARGAMPAPTIPGQTAAAPAPGRGGLNLNRTAVTDTSGRFVFDHVPPGQYTLSVNRDQFLALNYGEKQYGRPGAPIVLDEGQRRDVPLRMTRAGAISGTVLGEDGAPLGSAQVRVARYAMNNGFRRLTMQRAVQSDDRGVFRLFGLVPGDYILAVVPSPLDLLTVTRAMDDIALFESALAAAGIGTGGASPHVIPMPVPDLQRQVTQPPGYLPTYYPGASTPASATVIALKPGEERDGISFQVQAVRATNLTGTITGLPESATAPAGVMVFARPEDPTSDMGTTMLSGLSQQGSGWAFTIRDLAPGRYTIHAQTRPNSQALTAVGILPPNAAAEVPRLGGRVEVAIDGLSEPSPVTIVMAPGRTVSGRVVTVDGQPFRGSVTLMPEPTPTPVPLAGPSQPVRVDADGSFAIPDVFPGRYLFRMPSARSAMVAGQDALDFPFEVAESRDVTDVVITMGQATPSLMGQLTESGGAPTADYTIVLAPTDSRFWLPQSRRISTARPGLDGTFRFPPMPPGTYMLAALSDLEPGAQYDSQVLRELATASLPVTLSEGTTATQDIRLAR